MESHDTARKAEKSNRSCISAHAITLILLVVLIILGSAGVHKVYNQESTFIKTRSLTLHEQFPGYFRTKKQQADFEQDSIYLTKKRTALIGYSACCETESGFVTPDYAVDVEGVNRTIAQFPEHRQYFHTESCRQATNCLQCTCENFKYLVTAVYFVTQDSYNFGWFDLGSCCKCING